MAIPSAPVIARARSATRCKTSSRTNCPSSQTSSVDVLPLRCSCALRCLICSWRDEKARSACSASCPEAEVGKVVAGVVAEVLKSADSGFKPELAFCGLALMRTVEISVKLCLASLSVSRGKFLSIHDLRTSPEHRHEHRHICP